MFDELIDLDSFKSNITEETEKKPYNKQTFFKKKDELEEPYIPVAMYIDRDFSEEVKNTLYGIASKLIAKGVTVRINGDDKDISEKIKALSDELVELYIPWKGFNELESKHYFNSITSKHIAMTNFSGWEKVPDSVKAMLARNVRMVFGDKNNSICLCLITWSPDGASRFSEVGKDTGRSSFIIKVSSKYGFPVINMSKPAARNVLEKAFNL
jgi:hypothetical protein